MTRPTSRQRNVVTADRFTILNTFVDVSLRTLSSSEAAVWFVLYRDTRDGMARSGQLDIANRAGVSDRTVRRVLKRLDERGLVEVVSRGGLSQGASVYRVYAMSKPLAETR
ncbi:hypothetical protein Poly51_18540 [Rubripirellula tenax]|uniref:Uncharacterized protein n=1 Tax=Rubripirellula tenax TaxID=2528015 RepID=A0A5C6FC94_9BACT|nr:HTH domain-containing protein [Rubripirellula tenax]TWU59068.1 hypothetical protein Poly51_18540 [Rubripirellula tenax]